MQRLKYGDTSFTCDSDDIGFWDTVSFHLELSPSSLASSAVEIKRQSSGRWRWYVIVFDNAILPTNPRWIVWLLCLRQKGLIYAPSCGNNGTPASSQRLTPTTCRSATFGAQHRHAAKKKHGSGREEIIYSISSTYSFMRQALEPLEYKFPTWIPCLILLF